jgi:hypothetical protein
MGKAYAPPFLTCAQYIDAVDPQPAPEGAGAPKVPADPDWVPGVPSLRDLWPSIVGGAVVPLGVYYLVRKHVHSDAQALIIAGVPSVLWIVVQLIRQRRVDPVAAVVLFGFAVGVITSTLLHGNAYVLKARDSVFTALFGIVCLVTIFTHKRPAIFYVGRFLSAGNDPDKIAAFNDLHDLPTGEHTFKVLTIVWGIGLLIEASTRLVLAKVLVTGVFLAVSPVISAICLGSMFAFTVRYSNRARRLGESLLEEGQSSPPVPPT